MGRASADDAFTELLKDSDLSYAWQDEFTITIFRREVRSPRADDNVEAVVVTGTRLGGDEDKPAPVRVYGEGTIDRYGVSSVADFSRYLTQQPYTFSAGHMQSGAQAFQMRGLGFDTTLVLVNGRRMPPSANSISLNAVDLNSIPVTAVERIEVMSDSASAIYGADAIGGVVNIILKDKIERPRNLPALRRGGWRSQTAAGRGVTWDNQRATEVHARAGLLRCHRTDGRIAEPVEQPGLSPLWRTGLPRHCNQSGQCLFALGSTARWRDQPDELFQRLDDHSALTSRQRVRLGRVFIRHRAHSVCRGSRGEQ